MLKTSLQLELSWFIAPSTAAMGSNKEEKSTSSVRRLMEKEVSPRNEKPIKKSGGEKTDKSRRIVNPLEILRKSYRSCSS